MSEAGTTINPCKSDEYIPLLVQEITNFREHLDLLFVRMLAFDLENGIKVTKTIIISSPYVVVVFPFS